MRGKWIGKWIDESKNVPALILFFDAVKNWY